MTNKYLEKIASWEESEDLEKKAFVGKFLGRMFGRNAAAPAATLRGATRVAPSARAAEQGVSIQKITGQKRSIMNRLTRQSAPKSPARFVKGTANTDVRRSVQGIDTANLDQPAYLRRAAAKQGAPVVPTPAPKAVEGTPVAQPTPDSLRNNKAATPVKAPAGAPTAAVESSTPGNSFSEAVEGRANAVKEHWNSLDPATRKNIKVGVGAGIGGLVVGRATAPQQQNNYPANRF